MKIIKNNSEGIKEAAEILSANGIVAFPTETVYGLGASAFSEEAVTQVYKIKNRPFFNPLIIPKLKPESPIFKTCKPSNNTV